MKNDIIIALRVDQQTYSNLIEFIEIKANSLKLEFYSRGKCRSNFVKVYTILLFSIGRNITFKSRDPIELIENVSRVNESKMMRVRRVW